MKRVIAALTALAALSAPAPAFANVGQALGSPTFVFTGGGLIPQEPELDSGMHLGLAWLYDTSTGASIGVEGTLSSSTDPLRTHFAAISFQGRIGPVPDYDGAFVILGFGLYSVGYNPKDDALAAPNPTVRPGGNFGLGFEFYNWGNLSLGASGVYHGVLLHRGDKLAYVVAAATLTWRSSRY